MHYFSDLFDEVLYMFRTVLNTAELACHKPIACIRCWETPDDVQWTSPKHVEYFIK